MAKFDVLIRGGTVATAADTFMCDVAIRDGRIAALGTDLGGADEVIDATGKLVLPGGIDSHVHISQPSGPRHRRWPTISRARRDRPRSAAIRRSCRSACRRRGTSLREALTAYHALADGKCHIDVSFHLIISDPTRVGARAGVAGARRGRLHLLQGVHDLRGACARRQGDARGLRLRARDRRHRPWCMPRTTTRSAYLTEQLEKAGKTAPHISRDLTADSRRARGDPSRDQSRRIHRCADRDRARLEWRVDGADPLGTEPWPESLRRDLPAIPRPHREGSRRSQHGRREVRVQPAAA